MRMQEDAMETETAKALPKIYVFCNQKGCTGRGDWHNGVAMTQDGEGLAGHVSSSHEFLKSDLGNHRLGYRGFTREEYDKRYPDGYEVEWLEGAALDEFIAKLKAADSASAPLPPASAAPAERERRE